jgi:hypothetical protein
MAGQTKVFYLLKTIRGVKERGADERSDKLRSIATLFTSIHLCSHPEKNKLLIKSSMNKAFIGISTMKLLA